MTEKSVANATVCSGLPEQCYSTLPSEEEKIILVKRNVRGYFRTEYEAPDKEKARAWVDLYNGNLGITRGQEVAMLTGSLFGWDCPGADPKNYTEDGCPINPYRKCEAK